MKRLPLITIGIIVLCIVIFVLTYGRISGESEQIPAAYSDALRAYADNSFLELPDAFVDEGPRAFQKIYRTHREWMQEYAQHPDEMSEWVKNTSGHTAAPSAKHQSDLGVMADLMNPSSSTSKPGPTAAMQLTDDAKADMLRLYLSTSATKRLLLQNTLDERVASYFSLRDSAITNRFGYVPKHPGIIALFTYAFLHAGIFHLLMNMFFLWLVAPQLEDHWGKRVFSIFYLGCGVAGALVHHVTHLGSEIPIVGASGAIAGVMAAFAFRFGRSRIHFFYMYFALKLTPKTGTFEAPAHVMIGFWFLGQLMYAFIADFGAVAYWAHIGGFAAGLAVAIVFKVTDFEQKVLGLEPEKFKPQEQAPLIAFSALPKSSSTLSDNGVHGRAPQPTYRSGPHPRELMIDEVKNAMLHGKSQGGVLEIPIADVAMVAPGRMDRLGTDGLEVFRTSVPKEPAFLFALVIRKNESTAQETLYIVNAMQCLWRNILPSSQQGAAGNMIQFVKLLLRQNSNITYLHGPGPVGAHNMPIYDTFGGFLRHLQKRLNG
ncbi:MAG: rhomboid family intramembrane serine protease [Deltaproteobacteria bacterium]|nr:rhomboid family intramembrane serine protease [Deltaproteobacteria bacterium]MBN2673921.1 rhomboid family intramembrane serine protease [Deltaproteobacteria bacterium]